MAQLAYATATGDAAVAGAGGNPRTLYGVVLTPAAALSTVEVRDGSGGAIRLKLQAAASGSSAIWSDPNGVTFSSSIHLTLAGASAVAAVCFS
jgi:hypothetical protein